MMTRLIPDFIDALPGKIVAVMFLEREALIADNGAATPVTDKVVEKYRNGDTSVAVTNDQLATRMSFWIYRRLLHEAIAQQKLLKVDQEI